MILTHLVLFSFLAGASPSDAAALPAASGGWARARREETDDARLARIHAERVRMGILPPDPEIPTALERAGGAIAGGGPLPYYPSTR